MTTFHSGGARISITNFGDKVTIGGHAYVVIYSRVQVSNPTGQSLSIDPQASAGLVPLNSAGDTVQAHGSVKRRRQHRLRQRGHGERADRHRNPGAHRALGDGPAEAPGQLTPAR